MPYQRSIRFETATLVWHDSTLLEPVPEWSAQYRAASPRRLSALGGWYWLGDRLTSARRLAVAAAVGGVVMASGEVRIFTRSHTPIRARYARQGLRQR